MMIHLIYASSASRLMSGDELVELLRQARAKNEKLHVTGMLLYQGGNFLQVLEGEEETVTELYEVIRSDPRHYDVTPILKRPVTERIFPDWEMGFSNLDGMDLSQLPGYTDFLQNPITPEYFAKNPSHAYVFLNTFRQFGS